MYNLHLLQNTCYGLKIFPLPGRSDLAIIRTFNNIMSQTSFQINTGWKYCVPDGKQVSPTLLDMTT